MPRKFPEISKETLDLLKAENFGLNLDQLNTQSAPEAVQGVIEDVVRTMWETRNLPENAEEIAEVHQSVDANRIKILLEQQPAFAAEYERTTQWMVDGLCEEIMEYAPEDDEAEETISLREKLRLLMDMSNNLLVLLYFGLKDEFEAENLRTLEDQDS